MRTQIGLIAVVLLGSAAAISFGSSSPHGMDGTIGGLVKVGLIMAALWLALPQLNFIFSRTPKWLLVATVIAAVVVAIRPAIILYVGAALVLLWFFGPRLATKADPTIVPRRPRRKE